MSALILDEGEDSDIGWKMRLNGGKAVVGENSPLNYAFGWKTKLVRENETANNTSIPPHLRQMKGKKGKSVVQTSAEDAVFLKKKVYAVATHYYLVSRMSICSNATVMGEDDGTLALMSLLLCVRPIIVCAGGKYWVPPRFDEDSAEDHIDTDDDASGGEERDEFFGVGPEDEIHGVVMLVGGVEDEIKFERPVRASVLRDKMFKSARTLSKQVIWTLMGTPKEEEEEDETRPSQKYSAHWSRGREKQYRGAGGRGRGGSRYGENGSARGRVDESLFQEEHEFVANLKPLKRLIVDNFVQTLEPLPLAPLKLLDSFSTPPRVRMPLILIGNAMKMLTLSQSHYEALPAIVQHCFGISQELFLAECAVLGGLSNVMQQIDVADMQTVMSFNAKTGTVALLLTDDTALPTSLLHAFGCIPFLRSSRVRDGNERKGKQSQVSAVLKKSSNTPTTTPPRASSAFERNIRQKEKRGAASSTIHTHTPPSSSSSSSPSSPSSTSSDCERLDQPTRQKGKATLPARGTATSSPVPNGNLSLSKGKEPPLLRTANFRPRAFQNIQSRQTLLKAGCPSSIGQLSKLSSEAMSDVQIRLVTEPLGEGSSVRCSIYICAYNEDKNKVEVRHTLTTSYYKKESEAKVAAIAMAYEYLCEMEREREESKSKSTLGYVDTLAIEISHREVDDEEEGRWKAAKKGRKISPVNLLKLYESHYWPSKPHAHVTAKAFPVKLSSSPFTFYVARAILFDGSYLLSGLYPLKEQALKHVVQKTHDKLEYMR